MTCRGHASILVLFLINLLNYIDRFTLAGVLTDVQLHFAVDDARIGLLQTVFIIFYMSSALISGFLGDRYNRKWLITTGTACWVFGVFASSFIPGNLYYVFLAFRGVLGIGEACYVTIAPSLIADMFIASVRARTLMFFYFAAPLGSGLGYMFGSFMNSLLNSWVWGLRLTPILGVLCLILIASTIREPQRGAAEAATGATRADRFEETSYFTDIVALLKMLALSFDMFIASVRARTLMFFYFAAPLGSGLGYMFGSFMNSLLNSWVWGLRLTPILGVLCLILIASTIREPQRGAAEAATGATRADRFEETSYFTDIVALLKIPTYVSASIGYTAVTFAMVSLSWWGPASICHAFAMNAKLNSSDDISNPKKAQINFFFGLITIIGGLAGVVIGSMWAQMWSGGKCCFGVMRTDRANALVCAIGSFVAAPFLFFGLLLMDGNMAVAWVRF
ncbi:Protein spinster -like protein 1 [Toxocara canis]|uniref:Protein spinster-like protein 1 n=1 Tax=Toxocara canis TaxID=6265 RepID=A0A0B2VJP5_TOXCA|nr:Protein spinster -like protein 1 [Toxocara canis]